MNLPQYIPQQDVVVGNFKYHDCRENVIRNFLNALFVSDDGDTIQIELLHNLKPSNLTKKIIGFYSQFPPIKNSDTNDAAVKWADTLANLQGVTYWWPTGRYQRDFTLGDTHELNGDTSNFLRVLSHILGVEFLKIPTFETASKYFKQIGFDVELTPQSDIPIADTFDIDKPARLRSLRDDDGILVDVKVRNLPHYLWVFTEGHLEVYGHDHPLK